MNKGVWVKPELIVLVRNRPEEAVLANCKTLGSLGPGGSGGGQGGTADCNFSSGGQGCPEQTPS